MIDKKELEAADYCLIDTSPEYRLSKFERLTLVGGAELEKAIQWVAKQFTAFKPSSHLGDISIKEIEAAHDFYTRFNLKPDKFFVPPSCPSSVRVTEVHGLADGSIVDVEFPSTYQVQNSAFQETYNSNLENQRVYARWWRHSAGATATVVAIHGWTMGDQRLNSLAFLPGVFYQDGFDVVLLELPYHGRRATPGKQANLFPSSDPTRTNEAVGQAISDLRQLRLFLEQQGAKNIGCAGMSLGAYVGVLWASLDPMAFCVPLVPVVSMAELAWEILSRDPGFAGWMAAGLSMEMLNDIYYVHSPLAHSPRTGKERMLIIAGIGDEIVPPRQPKMLWDHWKRPKIYWFTGGHVAQFKRSKATGQIIKFLKGLCSTGDAS